MPKYSAHIPYDPKMSIYEIIDNKNTQQTPFGDLAWTVVIVFWLTYSSFNTCFRYFCISSTYTRFHIAAYSRIKASFWGRQRSLRLCVMCMWRRDHLRLCNAWRPKQVWKEFPYGSHVDASRDLTMTFLLRERLPNWQPEPFTQIHVNSRKRTLVRAELQGVLLNDDTTVTSGTVYDS